MRERYLCVRQPLLPSFSAAHDWLVHLHVTSSTVMRVAVVTALWASCGRTWGEDIVN